MRSPSSCRAAAAVVAAALGAGSPQASACESRCGGHGYRPVPASVYAAPPVYSYSYYDAYYGTAYCPACYTTRINIFRGPRWDYDAAYYTSYSGYHRRARGYGYAPWRHRGYMHGAILRASTRR